MSKVTNMALFIAVALLCCHFFGYLQDSGIGYVLTFLLDPENFQSSPWFGAILTAVATATGAAMVASFFAPQAASIVLKTGIVSALFLIGWDLIVLFSLLSPISVALATIIVSPLMLVFVIACVEWWS